MSRMLLVALREYRFNLQRPSFLFAAFGTPLIIVGLWLLIFLVLPDDQGEVVEFDRVGYVDAAAVIPFEGDVTIAYGFDEETDEAINYTFVRFATDSEARQALESGEVGAYYVVADDYAETSRVQRISLDELSDDLNGAFNTLVIQGLSQNAGLDPELWDRVIDPVNNMTVVLLDSGRELTEESLPVLLLTPFFFAIVFFMAMQTTSTFLMTGVVEEKKNRIIEIMVTTITPMQLLGGKIVGLGLLGLTQVTVWIGVAMIAYIAGPDLIGISAFEGVSIPVDLLVIGLVFFVLGYFMNASILAAIGVVTGNEQQANQYAAIVTIIGYIVPLIASSTFVTDPQATPAVLLSIFPLTAPLSMVMRAGFGAVPFWQLALSGTLLLLAAIFAAWASAKVFRWGLLLYGKSISLRDLIQVIRNPVQPGVVMQPGQSKVGEV